MILFLIFILFLGTVEALCHRNWDQFGSFCYLFSSERVDWFKAQISCRAHGATLAQVESYEELAFLQDHAKRYGYANDVELSTENDYSYHYIIKNGIDVTGHTSITFQVMACHNAHIALSKINGMDTIDTYEIVIGGWLDHQSVIRDCKQCEFMDSDTQQDLPLSCSEYRPFWISWAVNTIRVGKGNIVGVGTFLTWKDNDPHEVNYVAVSTGFGATGKWRFPKGYWLGGRDDVTENVWEWTVNNKPFTVTNWAPGEPNDLLYSEHNRNCLLMNGMKDYYWDDDSCVDTQGYICETDYHDSGSIIG